MFFAVIRTSKTCTVVSALAHAPQEPRKPCANANHALIGSLENVTITSYDGKVAKCTTFLYRLALYFLYQIDLEC